MDQSETSLFNRARSPQAPRLGPYFAGEFVLSTTEVDVPDWVTDGKGNYKMQDIAELSDGI